MLTNDERNIDDYNDNYDYGNDGFYDDGLDEQEAGVVDLDYFVEVMNKHWTTELKNVSSEALRVCWKQVAVIFGNHIKGKAEGEATGTTQEETWDVLCPPTGSGKTEGTIIYCALLHEVNVLIVTKLKEDCNLIAERINHFRAKYSDYDFDNDYAKAYHGDVKDIKREALGKYPVLVITHKAFENAMKHDRRADFIELNPFYKRDLVVIDETLDVIDTIQVTLNNLRKAFGYIESGQRKKYPDEIRLLNSVIQELEKQDDNEDGNKELMFDDLGVFLGQDSGQDLKSLELEELYKEVCQGKVDANLVKPILKLNDLLENWLFLGSNNSMNTAKLIIPANMESAVILDATAQTNTVYEAIDKCVVIPPVSIHTRDYSNFTLHVAMGNRTGKQFMVDNKKGVVDGLMDEFIIDDETFVITHKAVEPELVKRGVKHVGHYGAIDGANKWKDLKRVVVFGLPFLPETHYANIFNAAQGQQPQEWFDSSENRGFKKHKDIRKAIKQGQLSADVIQAINRISVRKTIDDKGNCPVCEGYILLPDNDYGKAILGNVKSAMPGIKMVKWDYQFQVTKKKGSKHEHRLMNYVGKMADGSTISTAQVAKELDMSKRTLERLLKKVKEDDQALISMMFARDKVTVDLIKGRRYFIKEQSAIFSRATAA